MAVRERNRTVARRRTADTESEVPVLTAEGRRMIESRVRRLQHDVLPVLVGALRESEGEGREELEYTQAEGELRRLTRILATSREIGEPDRSQGVRRLQLGDEVELRSPEGGAERLLIVHPAEAPLDDRRISVESPLGVAVLGRIPGEEVVVEAPGEPYRCRLVRWSRAEAGWRLIAEIVPAEVPLRVARLVRPRLPSPHNRIRDVLSVPVMPEDGASSREVEGQAL